MVPTAHVRANLVCKNPTGPWAAAENTSRSLNIKLEKGQHLKIILIFQDINLSYFNLLSHLMEVLVFYLKNNINYIERHDLALNSPSNFESAVIEINFPKRKNLIVACIYRHPNSKISIHDFNKNNMDLFLQKISDENKQCVLMGDFNIDILKCDSNNDSTSFYNILSSNFFTPYVLQPTRLHSKTLIDNLFFNSLEYTSHSGNLLIEISDHLIQFLILEGFIKERPIPILNMYKRDYSNFNENEFKEAVDGLDWHSIVDINQKDPNHLLNNFYNSITYLLDEFAPKKKVTRKEYKLKFKPWITNVILQQCKERDFLLKCCTKETDPIKEDNLYATYKNIRNAITRSKRDKRLYIFRNSLKKTELNLRKSGKELDL